MSLGMNQVKVRYPGKPLFYHSDGTGRDSYIVRNNGGILSQQMLKNLECKGEKKPDYIPMKLGKNNGYRNVLPTISDKFVHYHSDGSGRDSYVGWNHGGRINNFSSKNNTESLFRSTLRSYQKMPTSTYSSTSSSGFDFTNSNFYLSPRQADLKNETHQRQMRESNRLSRPKIPLLPTHTLNLAESNRNYYSPHTNQQN